MTTFSLITVLTVSVHLAGAACITGLLFRLIDRLERPAGAKPR